MKLPERRRLGSYADSKPDQSHVFEGKSEGKYAAGWLRMDLVT